jgi:hypothetical protein
VPPALFRAAAWKAEITGGCLVNEHHTVPGVPASSLLSGNHSTGKLIFMLWRAAVERHCCASVT